jgi:hypothetical protein
MRGLVCTFGLVIALAPMATFAANDPDTSFANAQAQMQLAQQRAADLQADADLSAQNSRMIALLQSQALRQQQVDTMANATAMDQISAALADSARAQGDVNARNALAIAQIKAAALVTQADSSLANAIARGRADKIENATARSNLLHQLADLLTTNMAELDMTNSRQIAAARADAIRTPALAQVDNATAMGANDLLAADTVLQAGEVNASSAQVRASDKAAAVLARAQANLQSAAVRAGTI